jgi:hypothetical protein
MVRHEISLFLINVPGELGKLATLFRDNQINIDAMSIQDASSYVTALYNARGKSLKRIASSKSYESMRRDSEEYALIRLIVDRIDKAIEVLSLNDYHFDIGPVIAIRLENKPGSLADVANRLGEEGINIKYVYGSANSPDDTVLFVFCPEDIDLAAKVFAT